MRKKLLPIGWRRTVNAEFLAKIAVENFPVGTTGECIARALLVACEALEKISNGKHRHSCDWFHLSECNCDLGFAREALAKIRGQAEAKP
jgi:hypothetical protein